MILDGFAKSPSAALRFNPALLDNNPRLDTGMNPLRFEWENLLEKDLIG
jgi:hypothetical protein